MFVNGNRKDCDYILQDGDLCTLRQYAGATVGTFLGFDWLVHGMDWSKTWTAKGMKKLSKWLVGDYNAADSGSDEGKKTPTISGCRNASALDKPVPLVLGKTYMTPYIIGEPYLTIDTSTDAGKPTFHAAYLVGYKDLDIKDISLGVFKIAANTENVMDGYPAVMSGSGAHFAPSRYAPSVEIRQGASELALYPQKVVQEEHGAKICGFNRLTSSYDYYRTFSAPYPHKVEVQIRFPNGLVLYDEKSKKQNWETWIRIGMSKDGGVTWEPFATFARATSGSDRDNDRVSIFRRKTADEMTFVATRTFSYSEVKDLANGVLELRIKAQPNGAYIENKEHFVNDVCIDYVRTWCFDPDKSAAQSTIVPQRLLEERVRNRTARIAFTIKAEEEAQGVLDQLNCICTSKARTWNGTAWSNTLTPTNNPASLLLLAMQGACRGNKAYPDSRIDFDSLGAFYEWCADTTKVGDGLPRFSCNGAVINKTKSIDLFKQIVNCGRGALVIDGDQYGVAIDAPKDTSNDVVHIINEQNILDERNSKEFDEKPDGFECRFVNALKYWKADSLVVWFDTTKPLSERVTEPVEYPFITDAKRVVRQAWYDYAIRKLRPETWERKVSDDGNLVNIGSLIEIQGSSISVGIGQGAEITNIITQGNYITGIVTDGQFDVADISKEYGVRIEAADGTSVPYVLKCKLAFTSPGVYHILTFDSPLSLDATRQPHIGDIVSFGLYEAETALALCLGKKANGDGTFNLFLVPYQAGVYTAETGKVPEYDSKLTSPRISGSNVSSTPATLEDINNAINFIVEGNSDILPDDVSTLSAVAGESGISVSPVYAQQYLTDSVSFKYQIKRGSSGEWTDISVRNGFYTFNRTVDGYPEKAAISTWKVRVKAVNMYGNESENWQEAFVDADDYGTWLVQTPSIASGTLKISSNGRAFHIECRQPDNLVVYGNIRYRISIRKNGEDTWYCPNITADPYGSEDAYKVIDGQGEPVSPTYFTFTRQFTQSVPLTGQSLTEPNPRPTEYQYKIAVLNEANEQIPIETDPFNITAYPVSARDVVNAWTSDGQGNKTYVQGGLKADKLYTENLVAISGTFEQIYSGGGNPDNFWRGMSSQNPEFRIGNDASLEADHSTGTEIGVDDDNAEYIHYIAGHLWIKLKAFIVKVTETLVQGTLTLYNDAKTIRNVLSHLGMQLQTKSGNDWTDSGLVQLNGQNSMVITNDPSAVTTGNAIPMPSNTIKVYHLDNTTTDQDGNNAEGFVFAGDYANASPILNNTNYWQGTVTKAGVVTKGSPVYNQPVWSLSGFTILGMCNGIVAGYTISNNIYTCKTYDIKTGTLRTSFDVDFTASTISIRKVKAFWIGNQFVFMTSYYATIPQVSSNWYWYCYMEDGTPRWGAIGGQDMGCAYDSSTGTYKVFAVGGSGKVLDIWGYDLGGYSSFHKSFVIDNQYVTQIEACLVAGEMIMLKCNNTNLSTNPWLYGVHYYSTAYISTNVYQNIVFVDSWSVYNSNDGYLHTMNTSGTRYLFKNHDLMNPVSISTDYYPIRNGADNNTVYLYKPNDHSIYTLVSGTYTKVGTTAASSSYLGMFDNNKKYYGVDSTIYHYPACNQTVVADKYYAFWFKGNSIAFGKAIIPTSPNNWLYCRITASGQYVSYYIVKSELVNGNLDVYSSGYVSLATYSSDDDASKLDFVLNGAVEELTVDVADLPTANMLQSVQYKMPYGNVVAPPTGGQFIVYASDPSKVISNAFWCKNEELPFPAQDKPPIGVPTLWFTSKPSWAIDFGNGATTQYLWVNYPQLNNDQFKAILTTFSNNGWCNAYNSTGFYVPDLRGIVPIGYGTNGKRTGETTAGGNLGVYQASQNKYHNHGWNPTATTSTGMSANNNHSHGIAGKKGVINSGSTSVAFVGSGSTYTGSTNGSTTTAHTHNVTASGSIGYNGTSGQSSKPSTIAVMWIVRFE